MSIKTKFRTDASEIMDDFNLKGIVLEDALVKIAKINKLLGGNRLTLQGLKFLLRNVDKSAEISIVDVGCGNGDMLRVIADFGLKNGYNFKLIGIDANEFTIHCAENLSKKYQNINYKRIDILTEQFNEVKCNIILCTLTLHHFKNQEIKKLLTTFYKNINTGIVINDLHRNIIAYRLFQLVSFIFRLNEMPKEDGLISILRGFKKQELIQFSTALNLKKYTINWKWAFRYQWIIEKV